MRLWGGGGWIQDTGILSVWSECSILLAGHISVRSVHSHKFVRVPVSEAMKTEETPRHLSWKGASSSYAPDGEEALQKRSSLDELPRQNSSELQSLSSYEFRGKHMISTLRVGVR